MSQTVCPEEIRTAKRREILAAIHASPEYRAASDAYLSIHPVCVRCGRRASQVVHHVNGDDYKVPARYADFTRCIVEALCNRCHEEEYKGKRPCPKCKKHYIPYMDYCCKFCLTDKEKAQQKADKKAAKAKGKEFLAMVKKTQQDRAHKGYIAYKARMKKGEV